MEDHGKCVSFQELNFRVDGMKWASLPELQNENFNFGHVLVNFRRKLYILGGPQASNRIYSYDPHDGTLVLKGEHTALL